MIERIKDCIFRPTQIAKYLKDKPSKIMLFMTIIIFLASIPSFIQVAAIDTYPETLKKDLKENIMAKNYPFPSCSITNYTLNKCESTSFKYLTSTIVFDIENSKLTSPGIVISFEELALVFYLHNIDGSYMEFNRYTYRNLEIQNLDFQELINGKLSDYATFNRMLDNITIETRGIWGPFLIFSSLFFNTAKYLLYAFILSVITRHNSKLLPFNYRFKISIYSSTIVFLISLISNLFGFYLLNYFDIIIAAIYLNFAYSKIIRIEIRN